MSDNDNLSRRTFLSRVKKAGASIAFAGGLSYLLYDSKGPFTGEVPVKPIKLPDFSVPSVEGSAMGIVKGRDRAKGLERAVDLIGGISRFVKSGSRVLIKPNAAFASSPELGATTHPDILSSLIGLCFKAGASSVCILDNPINDPASCFLLSGIEEAAQKSGAKIIFPEKSLFMPVTLEKGRLITNWPVFYKPLLEADVLIGVAPLKSHHRSGASMTMKNWYGLLGGRRNVFHQDINGIISELSMMVKPSFVILDAVDVMMINGPTGGSLSDLKKGNTIIASCDQVAADALGSTLLNLTPAALPFIGKAEALGSGTADYKSLKPKFVSLD